MRPDMLILSSRKSHCWPRHWYADYGCAALHLRGTGRSNWRQERALTLEQVSIPEIRGGLVVAQQRKSYRA